MSWEYKERITSNNGKQLKKQHTWDDEADRLLCRMYDEGKSISLLSDIFERTQGAIRSRLKKLGKIE